MHALKPTSFKTITFLFLSTVLLACNTDNESSNTGGSEQSLSVTEQKQFVLDVMNDYYLYYDQMPTINPNDFGSPEAVLEALLVDPDRFSFIANRASQESFFEEGRYEGIGYGRRINDDGSETILYVFDDSSAGRPCPNSLSTVPCLRRGDKILESERIGNDLVRLRVERDGSNFAVTLSLGTVTMNTVLSSNVQEHNGLQVGYLALSSFLEPTVDELNTAFDEFDDENIDELVLDLRYNSGGRVTTAQVLASLITTTSSGDVGRLEWNNKNTQENTSYPFLILNNQLDLDRLYVLTLDGTCSASELIINAMEGIGIDTITIGQTTCGKPVGSVSFPFGDKVINPITFSVVNDIGQGDYFDGIDATCAAEDDTSREFGNVNEALYASALEHMTNGVCNTQNPNVRARSGTANTRDTFNPNPMANVF